MLAQTQRKGFAISALPLALALLASPIANSTVSAQVADPTRYYGVGLMSGALSNTTVESTKLYADRVMFPRDGQIANVRKFHVCRSGYCAGTYGIMRYEIRADDGTAGHFPSSTVLGTATDVAGVFGTHMPLITFPTPVSVQAGVWYHLVVRNVDPNPATNYTSVNALYDGAPSGKIRNPLFHAQQFAVLRRNVGGSWENRAGHTSIADFGYSDGSHFGNGYMEFSSTGTSDRGHQVSGVNKVRQVFTPKANASVTTLGVALWRKSGASPVTATLTSTDGTVTATNNTAPLGGYGYTGIGYNEPYNQDYVLFNFPTTLRTGVTYYLELSAPSDTVYMVYGLRDGKAAGYGYAAASVFDDGYEQYNPGTGWRNWDTWGGSDTSQDMMFYFVKCAPVP